MSTKAKALYNYNATRDNEVAMKRGDNLVVKGSFGEWTFVTNLAIGKSGMVPTNYIRIITRPAATAATTVNTAAATATTTTTTTTTTTSASANATKPSSTTTAASGDEGKLDIVLLQDLAGRGDGCHYGVIIKSVTDGAGGKALAVKEGDIVKVLEVYPTGWIKAVHVITGAEGLVSKKSYVEYRAGDPIPAQFAVSMPKVAETVTADSAATTTAAAQEDEENVKFTAIGKFDYTGRTESELSFRENDKLKILDDKVPGGWWLATLNGKIGHVPPGYLERLDFEEEKGGKVSPAKALLPSPSSSSSSSVVTATTAVTAGTTGNDSDSKPKNEEANENNQEKPLNDCAVTTTTSDSTKTIKDISDESSKGGSSSSSSIAIEINASTATIPAISAAAAADPTNVKEKDEEKATTATKEKKKESKEEEEDEEEEEETHDPKRELPNCPYEATAVYDYKASSDEEVSVASGEVVTVISYARLGWVTVQKHTEGSTVFNEQSYGHVPRSWIKPVETGKYSKVDVVDNPDDFYKALYNFTPTGPSQIALKADDVIQVISKADP